MTRFQENARTDGRTERRADPTPLFHLFHYSLEIQLILRSCDQSDHTLFLIKATPIFFNQLFISINMYQDAKKLGPSIILFDRYICSIYDLKI